MKKQIIIVSVFVLGLSFSACSQEGDALFETPQTLISVVNCNTTTGVTPSLYTEMLSGDILKKLVEPSIVLTYHDINGNKTVCTDVGSTQLVR